MAQTLHHLSPRREKPFIKVNCATLPANLIESELFGHVKGAFSGAAAARKGRFELADGGTLFLDEIGDLPLDLQPKLLRAIQEREIDPLGAEKPRKVDVRLVAATHADLARAVAEGRFREDLYYRLNVFPVHLPPLRERPEDIAALAEGFLDRFARENRRPPSRSPTRVREQLEAYPWPGNVRELQNVLERAAILSTGRELRLPPGALPARRSGGAGRPLTWEAQERSLPGAPVAPHRAEGLRRGRGRRPGRHWPPPPCSPGWRSWGSGRRISARRDSVEADPRSHGMSETTGPNEPIPLADPPAPPAPPAADLGPPPMAGAGALPPPRALRGSGGHARLLGAGGRHVPPGVQQPLRALRPGAGDRGHRRALALPAAAFRARLPHHGRWSSSVLGIGASMAALEESRGLEGHTVAALMPVILGAILLLMPLFSFLGMVIGGALNHFFLWMWGGLKPGVGVNQSIRAYGYASAFLQLAGLIPYLGILVQMAGIVVIGMGLARMHKTDTWRGVCAALTPIILICCCGAVAAAMLIPILVATHH